MSSPPEVIVKMNYDKNSGKVIQRLRRIPLPINKVMHKGEIGNDYPLLRPALSSCQKGAALDSAFQ